MAWITHDPGLFSHQWGWISCPAHFRIQGITSAPFTLPKTCRHLTEGLFPGWESIGSRLGIPTHPKFFTGHPTFGGESMKLEGQTEVGGSLGSLP